MHRPEKWPRSLRLIEPSPDLGGDGNGRKGASRPHPEPPDDDNPASPVAVDRDFTRTLAALGGLAARKRLHALHPARPGDETTATGFAFTLLARLSALVDAHRLSRQRRPILWVQDRRASLEAGLPYAPGLSRFGLDPSQLVIVATANALDALAAVEIGLETGGLDGVLAELPPSLPADMLALGKRLALRAEKSATPCLLLHASATSVPAPVATRWQVASCPALADRPWSRPCPIVDLTLVKNRFGPTGRWSAALAPEVPSNGVPTRVPIGVSHVRVPHLPASLPEPLAAVPADRPRQASA